MRVKKRKNGYLCGWGGLTYLVFLVGLSTDGICKERRCDGAVGLCEGEV